jgi:hypothetical protein
MKQDLLEMEFSVPIIPTSGQQKIHTKSENVVSNKDFRFRFSISAGIIGNRLIGPHVLPPHLNGEGYLNFLQNEQSDPLDDVPLQVRRDMWYLHDGAPAHSARGVKNWLDANLENWWIGRNGPVLWPARSPNLKPYDSVTMNNRKGNSNKCRLLTISTLAYILLVICLTSSSW